MKFEQQAPCHILLQGKNEFPAKVDPKFEFHSKREIGLILRLFES
jgi:hypothetical protein